MPVPQIYGAAPELHPQQAQWAARKLHQYSFELIPEFWRRREIQDFYAGKVWNKTRVEKVAARGLPKVSGIYLLVVEPHAADLIDHSYIFYAGQAANLRRRFCNYLREKECKLANNRKEIVELLNNFEGHVYFHYCEVARPDLDHAECLLKDNLTPPANKVTEVLGRLQTA